MNKSDMLESLISHYTNGNKAQFAALLGIKPQTVSAWIARNTFDSELIYSKCENISANWLMTGEGDMLSGKQYDDSNLHNADVSARNVIMNTTYNNTVSCDSEATVYSTYLLPISSRGGSLTGFAAPGATLDNCEKIISPIANVDFAISVYGDSMSPEYPSGSTVLIKKIDPSLFIEWGKVYVLDTPNGVVLKEIHQSERDGYIKCHSVNPDPKFAEFEVPLREIFGMYRVLMCLSVK